jgi:hypothetical protein
LHPVELVILRSLRWAVEAAEAVEWRADIPVVPNRREASPLLYTLRAGCMGRRMCVRRLPSPDPNPSVTAMTATMTVKVMLMVIFAGLVGLGIRRARGV